MTLRVMSIFRVLVLVRYSSCVHKIEREVELHSRRVDEAASNHYSADVYIYIY